MRTLKRWALHGAMMGGLLAGCSEQTAELPTDDLQAETAAALGTADPAELDAARFLTQATFGPTMDEIHRVVTLGKEAWLQDQFTRASPSAYQFVIEDPALLPVVVPSQDTTSERFETAFFSNAMSDRAQLRQRVAFALSEIFVVSLNGGANFGRRPAGMATYHDMLNRRAFGTYRELLESVSRSPMMGLYLSSLKNEKARVIKTPGQPDLLILPDENYAREVMQLFSIGLYELRPNGTPRTLPDGGFVETYTQDDISGLARVFTGWGWACSTDAGVDLDLCFKGNRDHVAVDRDVRAMQANRNYHSPEEKRFLGTVIDAGTGPGNSLEQALDTLAAHHNVAPFISKQLIQRLVTSNPSPPYVARVATAFSSGTFTSNGTTFGTGAQGDLQATVAAILLDPEARSVNTGSRLREPILSVIALMRAFHAAPTHGPLDEYPVAPLSSPTKLGQYPYSSPSVFNFFRPGYTPPLTEIEAAGQVAPEFQIATEVTVAAWSNFAQNAMTGGVPGRVIKDAQGNRQANPIKLDFTAEQALADDADALVSRVATLLTGPRMKNATYQQIRNAVAEIPIAGQRNPDQQRLNRVRLAVYLTLISADFLIQ